MRLANLAHVIALSPLLAMLGCKQPVLCPPLASCGGPRDVNGNSMPPMGEWVLTEGHPSCTEDLYVPANDTRTGLASLPPTGAPAVEPALFDWCLLLVTGPDPMDPLNKPAIIQKPPRFYYESGPIGAASIKYEIQEGKPHFVAGITRTGTFTLDFPAYCVRAFGAMGNKPLEPGGASVDLCKQLEVPIAASGLGEGSYRNTKCYKYESDPIEYYGCYCTFDVTETGGPSGGFFLEDDSTITHLPGTNFPQRATFCQEGDRLQLTGADGSYLFDQRGVRTFDLKKACGMDSDCASGSCDTTIGVCR
jgi:hypothetical protein